MSTLVFHDPAAVVHDTGPGHPERIDRIVAVMRRIEELKLSPERPGALGWDDASRLRQAALTLHSEAYLNRLEASVAAGEQYIDTMDSAICGDSLRAAWASLACTLAAVDAVIQGRASHAFSAMRPPGHHAERAVSMGFCLLNNVAIAAEHLILRYGLSRVAIVDFDVHHGNGTQHLFEARGDVYFISSHENPTTCYPGTGFAWERGEPGTPGERRTLNVTLQAGSGHGEAIKAYREQIVPELERFGPQFVLVSAGFDADERDPLANLCWRPQTFAEISRLLGSLARRHAGGRIVSVLEGGYDLDALADGVEAHLLGVCDGLA